MNQEIENLLRESRELEQAELVLVMSEFSHRMQPGLRAVAEGLLTLVYAVQAEAERRASERNR